MVDLKLNRDRCKCLIEIFDSIPNIVGTKVTGIWHLIVLLTFDKTFENQGSSVGKEIKSYLSASEFF